MSGNLLRCDIIDNSGNSHAQIDSSAKRRRRSYAVRNGGVCILPLLLRQQGQGYLIVAFITKRGLSPELRFWGMPLKLFQVTNWVR